MYLIGVLTLLLRLCPATPWHTLLVVIEDEDITPQ